MTHPSDTKTNPTPPRSAEIHPTHLRTPLSHLLRRFSSNPPQECLNPPVVTFSILPGTVVSVLLTAHGIWTRGCSHFTTVFGHSRTDYICKNIPRGGPGHYVQIVYGEAHNNMNLRGQPTHFTYSHGFFLFFGCPVENIFLCCGPQRTAGTQKTGKKSSISRMGCAGVIWWSLLDFSGDHIYSIYILSIGPWMNKPTVASGV